MHRVLGAACCCFAAVASPARSQAPTRPNIVILLADDLGVEQLTAYGYSLGAAPTPVIDALAAGGVRFNNAWAYPICSATRAALMTGRHAFRTGIGNGINHDLEYPLQLSEIILPEMLDLGTQRAYRHAAIGKWHLGTSIVGGNRNANLAGFEHFVGTPGNLGSYSSWERTEDGTTAISTVYPLSDKVDAALNWVNSVTDPFLLYLPFHLVHLPWHAPPAHLHTQDLSGAGPPPLDPEPYFRAMLQALDTEIGRLLAGLGSRLANTVVLFLGDNGTHQRLLGPPFPLGHGKATLFEGGVRVPFIVSGPPVLAPGSSCDALVHVADVFATVAELAAVDLGQVLPAGYAMDSVSLAPYLSDPGQASLRTTNFSQYFQYNGPRNGVPVPLDTGLVCQPDVGFGGPGDLQLSVCGQQLVNANTAELRLAGAAPNSFALFVASLYFLPTPSFGGHLTPIPPLSVNLLRTDANGEFVYSQVSNLLGAPGFSFYVQAAAPDARQRAGLALSNTVRVDFLPLLSLTLRDLRYKLIWHPYFERFQFYDLHVDAFEANDLVPIGLTATEQMAFDQLLRELQTLVRPQPVTQEILK